LSSLFRELARRQIKGQAALTWASSVQGASSGDQIRIPWLTMTLALGLLFLFGQWAAWRQLAASGFYVATTPSSSFVYLLTGTHAIHLMGGVLALLAAGVASLLHRSLMTRSIAVDVTAWYWHFMAGLWIYILCLLEFA
jgi:cytochrome c oxidase subunit 3